MSVPTYSSAPEALDRPTFETQDQIVLILCGLVASGKSTFAQALQYHFPNFVRCNQDELGDRRRVERVAYDTLSQGLSVCIDRTNFNASQRSHWIEIAREFPGTKVWAIVFDTPFETCAARLQTRTNHPTIQSAEQGLEVLTRFASDFRHPAMHEGFDRILYIKPSDHASPEYSRADIASILRRVQDSQSATHGGRHNSAYLINQYASQTYVSGGSSGGWRDRHGMQSDSREYTRPYQHGHSPRGRGGIHNNNIGSLGGFYDWRSPPYRGNSVGINGMRGRALPFSNARSRDVPNSEYVPSQGKGTGDDPFIVD